MTSIVSSKGFSLVDANKELMFTPEDTAREIMDWVNPQISEGDSVLEPFKGDGVFYDKILDCNPKSYCEIDDGIDFFDYDKKVDWVISNPPFRVMIKKDRLLESGLNYRNTKTRKRAVNIPAGWVRLNSFIPIVDRTMEICNKGFFYLVNAKLWSSITVKRLKTWKEKGWSISRIKQMEIKKWYGRYYVVKFERNSKSLIEWLE